MRTALFLIYFGRKKGHDKHSFPDSTYRVSLPLLTALTQYLPTGNILKPIHQLCFVYLTMLLISDALFQNCGNYFSNIAHALHRWQPLRPTTVNLLKHGRVPIMSYPNTATLARWRLLQCRPATLLFSAWRRKRWAEVSRVAARLVKEHVNL